MIAIGKEPPCKFDKSLPQDPSPEEIVRRAAAIRRGWTDAQRKRRRVTAEKHWLPPWVAITDVAANLPSVPAN